MNKRERREQELLDAKNAYLSIWAEIHGQECADKSRVWYEYGWFYLWMARREGQSMVFAERPSQFRLNQLKAMTARLIDLNEMKRAQSVS